MEEMLSGCDNIQHYEIERGAMEQMEEGMRREKERAEERRVKKEKRRQMAKSQLGGLDTFNTAASILLYLFNKRWFSDTFQPSLFVF